MKSGDLVIPNRSPNPYVFVIASDADEYDDASGFDVFPGNTIVDVCVTQMRSQRCGTPTSFVLWNTGQFGWSMTKFIDLA